MTNIWIYLNMTQLQVTYRGLKVIINCQLWLLLFLLPIDSVTVVNSMILSIV